MLEQLEIHNYALIEDCAIEFPIGFTVITGETGAGKSIILGALSLLLGEKTEVQSIRSGCESATVRASFLLESPYPPNLAAYLEREGLSLEEESLVISRTIKTTGRSSVSVQGRLSSRSELAAISKELLDISAQRDHQSLLSAANQLAVLDVYGACLEEKQIYRTAYESYQALKDELERKKQQLEQSQREEDYLRFAVDEITKINPKIGEDEQIAEQVRVIAGYEQIHESLNSAIEALHGGEMGTSALTSLALAKNQIVHAAKADPSLENYHIRLESAAIEIEDIYESIRDYRSSMSYNEDELDRLQARLASLQRLKKKYGQTLDAVCTFFEESKRRLNLAEEQEIWLSTLENQIAKASETVLRAAQSLSEKRQKAALDLSVQVEQKLRTLGMKEAVFSIAFNRLEPGPQGVDEVIYQICANPGLEMRSIKDVASGGELSRIMLAVKTSLAESDAVPTLIFDEVDAGIGGSVALSVASQLANLSRTHQVIVITHLASIASKADTHLVVHKEIREQMSFSMIQNVNGAERQREIARMLSGDETSSESLGHAKKLLETGRS
ncbi:MAG: DNA repair protein RecN [Sphaerochaetaceae bacterium]